MCNVMGYNSGPRQERILLCFIIIIIAVVVIIIIIVIKIIINQVIFNPLNAKLNPICHLLTLLRAHHILHVSRIRVN